MIAVGIDPGRETGLVCVALGARGSLAGARWIGEAVLRPSTSRTLSAAEQRRTLCVRVVEQLEAWAPSLVVLEEPSDAAGYWDAQGQRGSGRGTLFGLGAHFGLALAATYMIDPLPRVVSYPCGSRNGRLGWMQGTARTIARREVTLERARHVGRALGAPVAELAEHHLMALGVLVFHVDQGAAALGVA